MALLNDNATSHRRLQQPKAAAMRRTTSSSSSLSGNLSYSLYADSTLVGTWTVELSDGEEEHWNAIDLDERGHVGAAQYYVEVNASRSDHVEEVAFLMQVVRMHAIARYRVHIAMLVFIITFGSIVSERINRSYSALVGSSVTLAILAGIQETPHLETVTSMVDWGTLMLLFSMMILVQLLALTGFFRWFAVEVVVASKQRPHVLFFMLTNLCGVLSMLLDNVTVVLLTGPLTYQIASKMKLNARPLFLSMTICATVGGAATRIGDPPNIVIGSMLSVGFEKFLVVNLPIVLGALLPVSSAILYWRMKDQLCPKGWVQPQLDLAILREENAITDKPLFAKLSCLFFALTVAFLLSFVHEIEPSWFCVMAMIVGALLYDHEHIHQVMEFVEWDTLLFFALLFVLVESLGELGMLRAVSDAVVWLIEAFPEDSRLYFALIIILWVSAFGSAFLESLPYTTTIVYIILDLRKKTIPGVDTELLAWPLSIGACIGGIGSIMGSSANLVCIAVAARCGKTAEEKVQGSDFMRYGLPVLGVLTVISTIWLLFLFIWVGFRPS
eukprot:NODE_1302_length_2529_cov_10.098251.p1 GENE.NODE_1302_length_2529_cov_10.098251~~NODE_1302_length_2529_cov_10.098251.p1  ORF type:complete len:639 (-),score=181.65 NODE_1302_length_2529_cov_10.098251:611-2278(-)